jgi:hypothetical protein
MDTEKLLAKIDQVHQKGQIAIQQKNLEEYMSMFTDDLHYTQMDGKTIGKGQLLNDQKRYFSRIVHAHSHYERISFEFKGQEFEETLWQDAELSIRIFFLRKHGEYKERAYTAGICPPLILR